MAPYKQTMAPTNAFPQHRIYNGDRMLGATVLCLVLGIWITLVHQGLSGTPRAASPAAGAAPTASR
jgi:hypothetical protein